MLKHRLITGPILIGVLLALVWCDGALDGAHLPDAWQPLATSLGWTASTLPQGLILFALTLALVPLAAREVTALVARVGIATSAPISIVAALLSFLSIAVPALLGRTAHAGALAATALAAALVLALVRFSRGGNVRGVIASAGGVLVTAAYVGALLAFWPLIRSEHSAWVVAGAIAVVKSCDTGAYAVGHAFGRHKLIVWLSPGKTWEGLVGGVATSALVGAALVWLAGERDSLPLWFGLVGGALIGAVGQLGDLLESLLKRDAGVKDSGSLLPGMGGLLDVLDSPLMIGPLVYWLLAMR